MVFKVRGWVFSWFQAGFSWFQMGLYGYSWVQTGFYGSRLVFMIFKGSRLFLWFQVVVFWLFKVFSMVFMVSCRFFIIFQGSRLVSHGSKWVLRVIHGSRSFFYDARSVFMGPGRFLWFFTIPGWFFMVPGSFSWFLWSQVDFYRHYQVGLNPSWAPEAQSEPLRTPQKVPAWSVSWPNDLTRPCRP